ncbi:MAG TPA: hypothetical protein QKA14_00725, partial [Candidatus Megaira endosymbiont of Hartmannula sinica]|nr:hypothetical protein [Candidatus Megaera endosymbiont of Hartmannula sinica]
RGIKEHDWHVINMIKDFKKNFSLIFTKSDKDVISDSEINKIVDRVNSPLLVDIISVTIKKNDSENNIQNVRKIIDNFV